MVDLIEALGAGASPDLSRVRGLWTRDGAGAKRTAAAPLVMNVDEEMPGRRMGSAAHDEVPRPQLALLRGSEPRTLRRALHDARLSLSLLVLLHPGALQERRGGGGLQGERQLLPLLEPWSRARRSDAAGRAARRAQREDRRRDVRAERAPCERDLRRDRRARTAAQRLGLRARRHCQGLDGRQARPRRRSLARLRHRGRQRARARRRRQGVRRRPRASARSRRCAEPASA